MVFSCKNVRLFTYYAKASQKNLKFIYLFIFYYVKRTRSDLDKSSSKYHDLSRLSILGFFGWRRVSSSPQKLQWLHSPMASITWLIVWLYQAFLYLTSTGLTRLKTFFFGTVNDLMIWVLCLHSMKIKCVAHVFSVLAPPEQCSRWKNIFQRFKGDLPCFCQISVEIASRWNF